MQTHAKCSVRNMFPAMMYRPAPELNGFLLWPCDTPPSSSVKNSGVFFVKHDPAESKKGTFSADVTDASVG